jgi:integrase
MILFAAATGLRPAEWVALEKRDIDRDERVAYVRRSYTRGEVNLPKTEGSRRAVPLQARAIAALERLPENDSPLVFPGDCSGYLDIHHFATTNGAPRRKPRASRRCGGSTIYATPSPRSRSVPASPHSTSPATWAPA